MQLHCIKSKMLVILLHSLFLTTLTYAQSPLEGPGSGLVAWWKFDEQSGLTAVDSSGNGNNGTLINFPSDSSQWTTGITGHGLSFTSANSYIDAGNAAILSPTQAITISAWVKPLGSNVANYLPALQKSNSYSILMRQDHILLMYLTGVNNWVTTSESKKDLFDGAWHHLVASYNGIEQVMYIDGVKIASVAAEGGITSNSNSLIIGTGFKGLMDSVRLYNRGLSQSEVQTLRSSYGPQRNGVRRTYYLSSSSGDNNNDGLTQATAWKTLDKIYQAQSTPNMFLPGDSILLKRSDTWEGQIKIDYQGKVGADPIVVGAYGSDSDPNPKIFGDGRGLNWSAVIGRSGVYEAKIGIGSSIKAVYENNTAYANSSTPESMSANSWTQPDARTDIVWIAPANGSPPSNIRVFRDPTLKISNSSNVIVENIDLFETWTAAYVSFSDTIILRKLSTYNNQDCAIYYDSATHSVMDGISALNSGNTVLYIFNGSNNTIRNSVVRGVYNTISGVHTPISDNAGIGLQQSKGNIAEYNKLYDILSGAFDYFYEADSIVRYNYVENSNGFYPHGTNNIVYGNIFDGKGNHAAFNGSGSSDQPNYIFNNTFYSPGSYGMMAGPGLIIRNNIMYGSGSVDLVNYTDTPSAKVDSDYNLFFTSAPYTNAPHFSFNGTLYQSLSAYQQASGRDAHSIYADPKFLTFPPTTFSHLALQNGSPAIDKGQPMNISKDFYSVNIPQGAAADIGAFEFSTVPIKPAAPLNLHAVLQ